MDTILKVSDITKVYNGTEVLSKVSFSLKKGHIYGFIGNNGAGKTTLMRIIAGLIKASAGTVELYGEIDQRGIEKGRQNVGFLIEDPIFFPDMSAFQNLRMQAILKNLDEKNHIIEVLKMVGLEPVKDKKVKDFSTGMKQKYGIAFALLGYPDLLVLDEPLNGMDVSTMVKVNQLFQKLRAEKNTTMLISSHLLSRLYEIADDFIFLHDGNVIEVISRPELDDRLQTFEMTIDDYFRHLIGELE